jgi:hypothetical protein
MRLAHGAFGLTNYIQFPMAIIHFEIAQLLHVEHKQKSPTHYQTVNKCGDCCSLSFIREFINLQFTFKYLCLMHGDRTGFND